MGRFRSATRVGEVGGGADKRGLRIGSYANINVRLIISHACMHVLHIHLTSTSAINISLL